MEGKWSIAYGRLCHSLFPIFILIFVLLNASGPGRQNNQEGGTEMKNED